MERVTREGVCVCVCVCASKEKPFGKNNSWLVCPLKKKKKRRSLDSFWQNEAILPRRKQRLQTNTSVNISSSPLDRAKAG